MKKRNKRIVKRAIVISIIVGTLLMTLNHWAEMAQGIFEFSWLINYLVPFIVSIVAALSNSNKVEEEAIDEVVVPGAEVEQEIREKDEEPQSVAEPSLEVANDLHGIDVELNNLLWSEKDNDNFERVLLSFLCRKFQVPCGVLYLKVEGEESIESVAKFSHSDRNKVKCAIGEGVIGQCFKERQSVHLERLPDNYFKVGSGLGQLHPKSILFLPLVFREKAVGVLELALFEPLSRNYQGVLENALTHCASFFFAKAEESKIQSLLDQSKALRLTNRLDQFKGFVDAVIREGKSEVKYLSNMPPVSGMVRANNADQYDEKGQSTFEQWVIRMTSIIRSLLSSKEGYTEVILRVKETNRLILHESKEEKLFELEAVLNEGGIQEFCVIENQKGFDLVFIHEFLFSEEETGQLILVASESSIRLFVSDLNEVDQIDGEFDLENEGGSLLKKEKTSRSTVHSIRIDGGLSLTYLE